MSDIGQEFAMSMYASSADRNAAMLAEIERLRETQHKFGQVQHDLLTQIDQLRQYLDAAQRRASALGDEVAGLLEVVESAAAADEYYDHPLAIQRLALMARAALAARKGSHADQA